MITSPAIGQLAAALAVAQGKFRPIPKNKTAKVAMKTGGTYTYAYADLADVLAAVVPELAANGLAVVQPVAITGAVVTIRTRLLHTSGEWVEEELSMHAVDDRPQSLGAAVTYGRRYALAGMLNVAPDDDVDGEVQTVQARTRTAEQAAPAPRPARTRPAATPPAAPVAPKASPESPAATPAPAGKAEGLTGILYRIRSCTTRAQLLLLVNDLKKLQGDDLVAARAAYAEKQKEIK